MAYCRNCYKELSFGEIVCTGCGKKIDTPLFSLPDETIRQNENTPINTDVPKNVAPDAKKTSVEKVKCKNCGTEYDSSKSSCPKCFSKESETIYKGTVSQAVSKADSTKMGFNSKEDRAKAVGVLSVIFAIVFLIYVIKHIQFSNSVDEYRKEIHDNKTATTTAITTNYIPKTTTKSTTTPSTTTDESNSGNVTESNDDTDNNKEPYEYRETMSVLNAIKSDHSEFNYYDVTEEGKFKFKISDIEYSAGGMNMGTDEWIYGDGYVVGCSILLDYNKEMIDNAGGIDKLNDKIIDEVLYLIYSPYLSEYKSMGIKDVIASKMKCAVKNKMHMYNDPDNFIGTGVRYGDYIYCVVCSENENGDAEIWKIDIVPYEEYIGPGLVGFHGDVVTDDDIGLSECGDNSLYSFRIDKSKWADTTSVYTDFNYFFRYTADSSINAAFGVIKYSSNEALDYTVVVDTLKKNGFKIESEEESTLGIGYSAYRVNCSYQNNKSIHYFYDFSTLGAVFEICCTSYTDSISAIEPEFEQILSTFEFGYRQVIIGRL